MGLVLWIGLCFSAGPAFALTPEQVAEDVALARQAMEDIHPGYARYTSRAELDQAWDALLARSRKDGLDDANFYLGLQEVLAEIRCDHTKAELSPALWGARKGQPFYLPIAWEVVDGRGLVTRTEDRLGVRAGDELLSIDGRPLAEMLPVLRTYIPYDGDTAWAREVGLAASNEFRGGAVDHFGGLLWPPPPRAALRLQRGDEVLDLVVDRIDHAAWKRDVSQLSPDFIDAVSVEPIGESAARMRIGSFVNYRNYVKPDRIFEPLFRALREEGRNTLVLDLRGNGGGSGDAQLSLLRHLVTERTRLIEEMRVKTLDVGELRPHLWTWEKKALRPKRIAFRRTEEGDYALRRFVTSELRPQRPAKHAFDGRLIILVDASNGSATTSLVAKLAERPNTVIIGEQTGGSAEGPTAGVLFFLTLPHSRIRVRVPAIRYVNAVSNPAPRLGVEPDVRVVRRFEAAASGEDPILEEALKRITPPAGAASRPR